MKWICVYCNKVMDRPNFVDSIKDSDKGGYLLVKLTRKYTLMPKTRRKKILDNQEIRAALDHYWEATVARDIDRSHDIYHDDVIVEFPQSGERISGKHNIFELRAHYPAKLSFKILRVRGQGNLWISEIVITYHSRRCAHSWLRH